jgi:NADPH:quinone reductase-like Zn-dependent oxidoreductase
LKAVVFRSFGDPSQVLEVADVPAPTPGPGEVRVRMIASPINPSDVLYVRGEYGKRPALPASPGFEGVGVVEASGGGIFGKFLIGKRVAVINARGGNWQEEVVIPAKQAVMVPRDLPDEQVATFFVNPATVLVMIDEVLRVPSGAWLLQTAAGSTLGRMVIRYARSRGIKTLNVVRRQEAIAELKTFGAETVISSSEGPIETQVNEITAGQGVRYAIDAVGGATGAAVARSLGTAGHLLVYGTLANEPMAIDPRTLIVGAKKVEGFWLSEWARRQNPLKMLRLFRRIGRHMRTGELASQLGASFAMDQVRDAVAKAQQVARGGKVLLRLRG